MVKAMEMMVMVGMMMGMMMVMIVDKLPMTTLSPRLLFVDMMTMLILQQDVRSYQLGMTLFLLLLSILLHILP